MKRSIHLFRWLYMVRTGADGHLEHVIAYLLAGLLPRLVMVAEPDIPTLEFSFADAGALELGQICSPGRHPALGDFAASSIGVVLGVMLIWFWSTYRPLR